MSSIIPTSLIRAIFQGNIPSNALFGQSTQMFGRGLTNPGRGSGGFNPLQVGRPRSIQVALKLQF